MVSPPHDFESCASANSATCPLKLLYQNPPEFAKTNSPQKLAPFDFAQGALSNTEGRPQLFVNYENCNPEIVEESSTKIGTV